METKEYDKYHELFDRAMKTFGEWINEGRKSKSRDTVGQRADILFKMAEMYRQQNETAINIQERYVNDQREARKAEREAQGIKPDPKLELEMKLLKLQLENAHRKLLLSNLKDKKLSESERSVTQKELFECESEIAKLME